MNIQCLLHKTYAGDDPILMHLLVALDGAEVEVTHFRMSNLLPTHRITKGDQILVHDHEVEVIQDQEDRLIMTMRH